MLVPSDFKQRIAPVRPNGCSEAVEETTTTVRSSTGPVRPWRRTMPITMPITHAVACAHNTQLPHIPYLPDLSGRQSRPCRGKRSYPYSIVDGREAAAKMSGRRATGGAFAS